MCQKTLYYRFYKNYVVPEASQDIRFQKSHMYSVSTYRV